MNIGIIPARYAASRLPGKPLRRIGSKTMIQWVYEGARASKLDVVVVATDHPDIVAEVTAFGGQALLTDPNHPSGTDRCAEVAKHFAKATWIVNIQGDEPFVQPAHIDQLTALAAGSADIATLVAPLTTTAELRDPNVVKAVFSPKDRRALYFSRAPIPYDRDGRVTEPFATGTYFRHLGMYAYRASVLPQLAQLAMGHYENIEKLEQLRWLEAGYRIEVATVNRAGLGVDTETDLARARQIAAAAGEHLRPTDF